MRFDVYTNYSEEVAADENTMTEKSVRKRFRGVTKEEAQKTVNEFFDSLPENVTNVYVDIHKTYEEQLEAALKSI